MSRALKNMSIVTDAAGLKARLAIAVDKCRALIAQYKSTNRVDGWMANLLIERLAIAVNNLGVSRQMLRSTLSLI